jgi:hypothetical protein
MKKSEKQKLMMMMTSPGRDVTRVLCDSVTPAAKPSPAFFSPDLIFQFEATTSCRSFFSMNPLSEHCSAACKGQGCDSDWHNCQGSARAAAPPCAATTALVDFQHMIIALQQ